MRNGLSWCVEIQMQGVRPGPRRPLHEAAEICCRIKRLAEVMFFAYLCALSLVVSETADMSRGFPYPPDTRPVGCRKYKRRVPAFIG